MGEGAIGNARWSGFRLSDVLEAAGLRDQASHVWFEGLDQILRDNAAIPFGGSIPLLGRWTYSPGLFWRWE